MNTNILKKCIDELNTDVPRLDYLRGMLETLVALQPDMAVVVKEDGTASTFPMSMVLKQKPAVVDDAVILDAKARAALETIKAMGGEQTE